MNTKFLIIKAIVVACFVLASFGLSAQQAAAQQTKDFSNTVVLKNGTEINNANVEEAYVVTTTDGKSTVYKKDEVASVSKLENRAGSENWSANLGYMNWEDAKAKCASQKMRLPTLDELKAAQSSNVTDSWKKQGYLYWSVTQTPTLLGDPYLLYAFNGEVYSTSRYANNYVRCIK